MRELEQKKRGYTLIAMVLNKMKTDFEFYENLGFLIYASFVLSIPVDL